MRFLKLVRAVLWSLFGVRRRTEALRDLEGVSPWTLGAAAVITLGLVIGTFALLVTFLARDRAAAPRDMRPPAPPVAAAVQRHGPVTVRDTIEERVAPCMACHTDTTQATHDGFSPRIAGKPAGYLYNQLVSFRDGRRTYPPMVYLLQNLSDDYLREIAEHFSALRLPHPAPQQTTLSPDQATRARMLVEKGDPGRGVPACIDCHGTALAGVEAFIPAIVGLPRQYMNAQFGAWRNGRLRSVEPDCMAEVARRLAAEDTAILASWLAGLPVGVARPESGPKSLPLECGSVVPQKDAAAITGAHSGKGAYLVAAGDCIACHTAPGGKPFAGGRAIDTPFGTVYSSNITADERTGIGSWSRDDFRRALHEGRSRDGRLLYPAFPYPNFTQVSSEDADAMFDHLRSLPSVRRENTPHAVRWPYSTQVALRAWRALFFRAGTFRPEPGRDAQWNRGAYLVRGLGHCDACHASRNIFGAPSHSLDLGGGLIPMQNWFAPPLASAALPDDIVALLTTGIYARGTAMGPMAEVVQRSTQHLAPEDARAIASYLQTLPARPAVAEDSRREGKIMARGATVYGEHCAQCHGDDGQGAPPAYPPLAGNPALSSSIAANAIKAVLHGGYAPSTAANPRPYGMPAYAGRLSDADIADVLTYVRASWGNRGTAVSTVEIERYRGLNVAASVR